MADQSVLTLAEQLLALANSHRASKPDLALEQVLSAALHLIQERTIEVSDAAERAKALGPTYVGPEINGALRQLESARAASEADAIAFVTTADGHARLLRALGEAVRLLDADVHTQWQAVRAELSVSVPEAFVQAALKVPPLREDAAAILAASAQLSPILKLTVVPDPGKLARAREASKLIQQGLARLNEDVPASVRPTLQRAAAGELRLDDVTDDFREWLQENELGDSVRVTLT